MKYIHFPTLALHGLNMILAFALIHEYSDVFLFCAIAVLIVHVIWCCISPKPLTHTHLLGCLLQALFFAGRIDVRKGNDRAPAVDVFAGHFNDSFILQKAL